MAGNSLNLGLGSGYAAGSVQTRLLELMKQREVERAAQEQEAIDRERLAEQEATRRQAIEETKAYREAQQAGLNEDRANRTQDREDTAALRRMEFLQKGDPVDNPTYQRYEQLGLGGKFDRTLGSTPITAEGMGAPQAGGNIFKGTPKQEDTDLDRQRKAEADRQRDQYNDDRARIMELVANNKMSHDAAMLVLAQMGANMKQQQVDISRETLEQRKKEAKDRSDREWAKFNYEKQGRLTDMDKEAFKTEVYEAGIELDGEALAQRLNEIKAKYERGAPGRDVQNPGNKGLPREQPPDQVGPPRQVPTERLPPGALVPSHDGGLKPGQKVGRFIYEGESEK